MDLSFCIWREEFLSWNIKMQTAIIASHNKLRTKKLANISVCCTMSHFLQKKNVKTLMWYVTHTTLSHNAPTERLYVCCPLIQVMEALS